MNNPNVIPAGSRDPVDRDVKVSHPCALDPGIPAGTTKSVESLAVHALTNQVSNPQLEAELLLARAMQVSRSYLYAYPEKTISSQQLELLQQMLKRRRDGEPMAYILEEKEFWSLNLRVTPDTLIPRPETELLVELVLQIVPKEIKQKVADLGTGSGAIALALGKERPQWQITATDQSAAALEIAQQNAQRLAIKNIDFYQGAWCSALPKKNYHALVSNPPYIPQADPHLSQGDLRFEPQSALVSGKDGLDAIRIITAQALQYLMPGGYLFLEHGFDQAAAVRQLLLQAGYQQIRSFRDLSGQERVSLGQLL